LHVTTRAVVDELAAAADLAKGKVDHIPVAVVSGTGWATVEAGAGARGLVRPQRDDWFDYGRAEAVRAALGVEPGSAGAERVGIPGVGTEDVLVRVERAVGVACAGLGLVAGADASRAGVVEVSAGTAFRAGLVVARLQVALWGEGFDSALDGDAVHGERSEGKAATGGAGGWRAEGEVGDWRARVTYTQR
jgi:coenzyme F420-0:L-glutamate ligase/coenzyme F420-1:gamma-L-glutamate ligase